MLRGTFARVFAAYLAVLLVLLLAVALLVTNLVRAQAVADRQRQLLQHANDAAALLTRLRDTEGSLLQLVARLARADIIVVDAAGRVRRATRPVRGALADAPAADLRRVLAGEPASGVTRHPLFAGVQVVWAGVPMQRGGQVVGAVFLHTTVREVGAAVEPALATVRRGALVGVVVGALVLYFVVRRIVGPLEAIAAGASRLAAGDLTTRVPVAGSDEVASVAGSFNAMAAELERSQRARRELLAAVSHELRTPLTSIRGFVRALLDGAAPDAQRDHYLRVIAEEADRLARMTGDLLDLALLDAGELRLDLREVDLRDPVTTAAARARILADERGVRVEVNVPERPVIVHADRERLQQVLANLLGNALRYAPAGSAVEVRMAVGAGSVEVSVRDQGPGIDSEHLPHLWEPFYKADPSRTRSTGGGTGLGLAVVRRLVEAHGGTTAVENVPAGGAIFRFTLPLAREFTLRS